MIYALAVSALVIVVLTLTVISRSTTIRRLEEGLTLACRGQDDQRALVDDLRRERNTLNEYAGNQHERAERLLAQVYDLRAQMGLAPRAHTECVDMWADGGQPCAACVPLLGVRG